MRHSTGPRRRSRKDAKPPRRNDRDPQRLCALAALREPPLRLCGSWSQCAIEKSWRLSMNRQVLDCASPLALSTHQAGPRAAEDCRTPRRWRVDVCSLGSWSRFASKIWRLSLSMNRRVRARGPHCVGRVPRPGGSWSQCAPNLAWGLSMNRLVATPVKAWVRFAKPASPAGSPVFAQLRRAGVGSYGSGSRSALEGLGGCP